MATTLPVISVTASGITTFDDCEAKYFHEQQRYQDGVLRTDRTAAEVSSAAHDALMTHHRQIEQGIRANRLPSAPEGHARLRRLLDLQLRKHRLDRSNSAIAERLARLDLGIDCAADLVLDGARRWARDALGIPLAWAEAWLDHGPDVRAIELALGFRVRTKPDVVGIRAVGDGRYRVLVRDYKAKKEVIDPAFDTGILLRAIWAVLELRNPRCRWFLVGRDIEVDPDRVDLETVNLLHAPGQEFLMRATLTAEQILDHRDRFVRTMDEMAEVTRVGSIDEVLASPSGLCLNWCPFLDRCDPGMAHVRKYSGEDVLQTRLGGR